MAKTFQFRKDLLAFAEKIRLDYGKVVSKVIYDLDKKIILRTPVDTGWARMNWNISVESPDMSHTPSKPYEPGSYPPQAPEEAASFALGRADRWVGIILSDPFHVFYISNGIPYIEELEAGHSHRQAPAGMVAISLAEVEAEII